MWDRHIQDLRMELERIIQHKCYWYVLHDTVQTIHIDRHIMAIKLPVPHILGTSGWHDEWKWREHNEAELKRVRNIWSRLIEQMKEKLDRIAADESAIEEEFRDGILFEGGKYGLAYQGKMVKRDGVWKTVKSR